MGLIEESNLYRAVGELAYVLAKADGKVSRTETIVFQEAIKEDLGKNSWLAQESFDKLLDEDVQANVEAAYNRVLFTVRRSKNEMTEEMLEKFISVLEKVAGVSGITEDEINAIEKFREDVMNII